jgi:cytoskeletal protein CcmA (bactofilin family)
MFTDSKSPKSNLNSFSQQNTITKGTKFNGDITSQGDFRIEGQVNGSISTTGKIVIGKTGSVDGTLVCKNADFEGKFKGTLTVSEMLSLRGSAHVEGEVQVSKLAVEPGANFNANCIMKGAVKELKKEVSGTNTSKNISKAGQSA